MSPAAIAAVWAALTPKERETLVGWLLDAVQGKPPKAVRIAALRKREIAALAKVAGRLR